VLTLALSILVFAGPAYSQGNDNIVPTDPHVNRVNWAAAQQGSAIAGCPSGVAPGFLIDSFGGPYQQYITCLISSAQALTIDLGVTRTFDLFQLHLYDGDDRFFRYKVESSLDGSNYDLIVDRSTGEHRGVQRIPMTERAARYLKISGLFASVDSNDFRLIDEIHLIGTTTSEPEANQQVTFDGKVNAGGTFANGVKVNLNAGIYKISHVSGATSKFSSDVENGGKSWDGRIDVAIPLFNKSYQFGFVHSLIDRYATAAEADAAMQGSSITVQLPAQADLYLWLFDTGPSDNRGSHTVLIQQLSGPNEALLERVRDTMTRSVLWQQEQVANWSSAPNWFSDAAVPNCYGCHQQSQAVEGLNASRAKLPSLPVSDKFMSKTAQIFVNWQSGQGWVSPYHGVSHNVSQTSLWTWALSSYPAETLGTVLQNLMNGLNWLATNQQGNGGWNADHGNADHGASALYDDGTPSAAHTTGNIESIARVLPLLGDGDASFVPFENIVITGNSVTLGQNYGTVNDVLLEPLQDVTGIKIQISDTFAPSKNFVLSEFESFNNFADLTPVDPLANFQQDGYPIAESVNGISNDTSDGWGYAPNNPTTLPALGLWKFTTPQDLNRVRINQIYPEHQLKTYAFEYTTDANPSLSSNFQPALIQQVGMNTLSEGSLGATLLASLRKAADLYLTPGWDYDRNTRTAAQTIIGLHAALPFLEPEKASAAATKLTEIANYLRSIQRADGGWYDSSGISRVYPSAIALRALLLLNAADLDDVLLKGADYLITTQGAEGSWASPPIETRLAATTWVEIALPTLFDVLSQNYLFNIVPDVTAYGLQNKVQVNWTPLSQAVSYNIYRRTADTPWVQLTANHVSSVAEFIDTNVVNEATYYYKVRWNSVVGLESSDSNEASGTPYGMMCGGDSPPIITSPPVLGAVPGVAYSYQVEASDADVGDILTYLLELAPSGMSIDPQSGLITWAPTAQHNGPQSVKIRVNDQIGRFAIQAYTVSVAPIYVNDPPQFSTTPGTDYQLITGPPGTTINSTTGRVRWTAAIDAPVGSSEFFKLKVVDTGALTDEQEFTVNVVPNTPPVITSTPQLSAPRLIVYTSHDFLPTIFSTPTLPPTIFSTPTLRSL